MIVYSVSPIDYWGGWQPPEHLFELQEQNEFKDLFSTWEEWEAFWNSAHKLARRLGWEGDVRQGPYIAGLPNPDYAASSPMVGWKQDNNGTTFIATEIPLPWLGTDFVQKETTRR